MAVSFIKSDYQILRIRQYLRTVGGDDGQEIESETAYWGFMHLGVYKRLVLRGNPSGELAGGGLDSEVLTG
jgi:hypothetical protein